MKCFNHQSEDAIGVCTKCGKGICLNCAAKTNPLICSSCSKINNDVNASEPMTDGGTIRNATEYNPIPKYSYGNTALLLGAALIIDGLQFIPTDALVVTDIVDLPLDLAIPEVIIPFNTILKVLIAANTLLFDAIEYSFLSYLGIPGRYAFPEIIADSIPGVNVIPFCTLGVIYTRFIKYGLKPYQKNPVVIEVKPITN